MMKPTHEELVEATADYLSAYVGTGVSIDPVIQNLDPQINIRGLRELLEYQFLLSGRRIDPSDKSKRSDMDISSAETGGISDCNQTPVGVLDFTSLLQRRLASIDPALQQRAEKTRGEVRGAIDWSQTFKQRQRSGDTQGQIFVSKTQRQTVQTSQNRVLVCLLDTIQIIFNRLDEKFFQAGQSVQWLSAWQPDSELRQLVNAAVENPYLSEVDGNTIELSNRELRGVLNDRNPLYREAAALLQAYRQIIENNITQEQAKDLFRIELFAPSEDGTSDLFELYWIFTLLDQFESPQFRQIGDGRGQLIATWERDGSTFLLFNDWQGTYRVRGGHEESEYIRIELDGIGDAPEQSTIKNSTEALRRQQAVMQHRFAVGQSVFNYGQGRKAPDIVLLKIDRTTAPPTLQQLFIGEVKHSTARGTVEKGVQQLLEYGAHAKVGTHLQLNRDVESEYVAASPQFLDAPELELGYFVGHSDIVNRQSFESMQICGYGDSPRRPFHLTLER